MHSLLGFFLFFLFVFRVREEEIEKDRQAKPGRHRESSAGIWAQAGGPAEEWAWILKRDSNLFGHKHFSCLSRTFYLHVFEFTHPKKSAAAVGRGGGGVLQMLKKTVIWYSTQMQHTSRGRHAAPRPSATLHPHDKWMATKHSDDLKLLFLVLF